MIERTVRDFMTTPPRTLPPDAPVVRAAQRLRAEGIGSVVVTADGTAGGALEGVLTESDVVDVVASERPVTGPVRETMSSPAVTLGPDAPVDRVGDVVCDHGVRHIPVVEDGVVGVVTATDVACLLPTYRLEPDGPAPGDRDAGDGGPDGAA